MCTVSWVRKQNGYLLLFNRDELRTRRPATGPLLGSLNRVSYIAPRDGDQGGSWIGVNQFGLTLGLLNRFDNSAPARPASYTSRGLLLQSLLDCAESKELMARLAEVELTNFRPFTLMALNTSEPAMLIEWNGSEPVVDADAEKRMPLTSSSLDADVSSLRQGLFEEMALARGRVDSDLLYEFHRSHQPARGPVSICMHRADAKTVSLSIVMVTQDSVEFLYYPGSPCKPTSAEKAGFQRPASPVRVASL